MSGTTKRLVPSPRRPHAVTLVDPADGLRGFSPTDDARVALLAQTTLGVYEWEDVLEEAQERYPELLTARKSDLCYATTNRQTAVRRLAELADVILVVGSETSSNTQALVRVARKAGVPAHRVDGPEAIDPAWIADADLVGVTAGASAPDQRVQAVIEAVDPREGVELVRISDEDEYFPLPPAAPLRPSPPGRRGGGLRLLGRPADAVPSSGIGTGAQPRPSNCSTSEATQPGGSPGVRSASADATRRRTAAITASIPRSLVSMMTASARRVGVAKPPWSSRRGHAPRGRRRSH